MELLPAMISEKTFIEVSVEVQLCKMYFLPQEEELDRLYYISFQDVSLSLGLAMSFRRA